MRLQDLLIQEQAIVIKPGGETTGGAIPLVPYNTTNPDQLSGAIEERIEVMLQLVVGERTPPQTTPENLLATLQDQIPLPVRVLVTTASIKGAVKPKTANWPKGVVVGLPHGFGLNPKNLHQTKEGLLVLPHLVAVAQLK